MYTRTNFDTDPIGLGLTVTGYNVIVYKRCSKVISFR